MVTEPRPSGDSVGVGNERVLTTERALPPEPLTEEVHLVSWVTKCPEEACTYAKPYWTRDFDDVALARYQRYWIEMHG